MTRKIGGRDTFAGPKNEFLFCQLIIVYLTLKLSLLQIASKTETFF